MQDNQPRDTPLVHLLSFAHSATCAATPIEMPASSSANASLLGISRPSLRKSLKLLWQQRGPRKREVFAVPKKPNADLGHLLSRPGMEGRTRRAPRRRQTEGWSLLSQVLLTHSGCSASRSHATPTQSTDYVAVPQEVAPLLAAAECHLNIRCNCRQRVRRDSVSGFVEAWAFSTFC
jgi:hypothetical protein